MRRDFWEYVLIAVGFFFIVWALFVNPAYGGELRTGSSGGGVAVTGSITGAVANCVLYADAAGTALDCEAAFTYDESTNTLAVDSLISNTDGGWSNTCAQTSGTGNECFGAGASITAAQSNQLVIGKDANSTAGDSVAVGRSAQAASTSVAVGKSANTSANEAVGIGEGVLADQNECVAIGRGADCTAIRQFVTGSPGAPINAVSVEGGAMTPSACGTSPSVIGNGVAGKVTIGTGVTTSCTLTFPTAHVTTAPACVVTGDNSATVYAATTSTTALVITSSLDMDSDVVMYICIQGT